MGRDRKPVASWSDGDVQIVYRLLCSEDEVPDDDGGTPDHLPTIDFPWYTT